MTFWKAGRRKPTIAIAVFCLALFILAGLLPTSAVAAQQDYIAQTSGQAAPPTQEQPGQETGAADEDESTQPDETEGTPDETNPEDSEDGLEEQLPEEEQPEEQLEDKEKDTTGFPLESIEYSIAPLNEQALAELLASFPYGGTEEEQAEFLQALPKWQQPLDEAMIPRGWMQKQAETLLDEVYWTLVLDTETYTFIADAATLKTFMMAHASRNGVLVNDIYMDETIAKSNTPYSGHELDGNGFTIYAPPTGRHFDITLASSASLTLTNVTFDGQGKAGGLSLKGYANSVAAKLTMNGVTVQNNVVDGDGTVYLANLTIKANDSSFINNTALGTYGGGLMLALRVNAAFNNCRIEGNDASKGGGVYINLSGINSAAQQTVTFTGCTIDGNTYKGTGQAFGTGMHINSVYGVITLQNTTLNRNYSTGSWGRGVGLYVENGKTTTLNEVEFVGNYAEDNIYGGAFYIANGEFNMSDCFVKDNQTRYYFGAGLLYNQFEIWPATITNTKFIDNFTRESTNNDSSINGGGALGIISLSPFGSQNGTEAQLRVRIEGCEFTGNRAAPGTEDSKGGAMSIYLSSTYDTVWISDTTFEQNTAAYGGAVYLFAAILKFSGQPNYYRTNAVSFNGCTFRYNVATISGGAIGVETINRSATAANIEDQMAYYNMFHGRNLTFEDNLAATGHIVPTNTNRLVAAMTQQFNVTPGGNANPALMPLSAPFAINHTSAGYRSVYNNYDVAQTFNNTQVTTGTVKLVYHANGASSLNNSDTFTFTTFPNRNLPLLYPNDGSMGFEMENHRFVEWNTAYDGTGTAYQPGELLKLTTDMLTNGQYVLYAIWDYAPGSYSVTYKNVQGGESHTEPVTSLVEEMTVLTPGEAGFTAPDDHVFTHWLGSDGSTRAPGSTFLYDQATMGTNLTLTAQWEEKPGLTVSLLYVDSEGQPLGSTALAQNPQEVFGAENEQLTIGDLLATLNGYKALYYTVEGSSTKYSLANDPFLLTSANDGTVLQIICASTMLNVTVPTTMQFYAMSANGNQVQSPVYSFINQSELPADVSFVRLHTTGAELEDIDLDPNGILFVEDASDAYEMHLTLEADTNTMNNGFEDRFTGTNGKPGIQPDSAYTNAVVARLAGSAVQANGNSARGAFTIGGQYAGPFEMDIRTPTIAFEFHIALRDNAEYTL